MGGCGVGFGQTDNNSDREQIPINNACISACSDFQKNTWTSCIWTSYKEKRVTIYNQLVVGECEHIPGPRGIKLLQSPLREFLALTCNKI